MKKALLTITSGLIFSFGAFAQLVPNAGMENWSTKSIPFPPASWFDPDGWATTNVVMGSDTSVTRVKDKYAGIYAAKIVTKRDPNGLLKSAGIKDTAGVMITGTISGFSIKRGFPHSLRSKSVVFFSKYTPAPTTSDFGMVLVSMTKWNGTKHDTIGTGTLNIITPSNSYGITEVNIIYRPAFNGVNPDTCTIALSSSNLLKPKLGSTLYVDDFQLTPPVGINENKIAEKQLYAYPSPSSSQVTIMIGNEKANKITVYDVTGKEVKSYMVESRRQKLDVSSYSPGLYIYSVTDKENNVLGVSKFNVLK